MHSRPRGSVGRVFGIYGNCKEVRKELALSVKGWCMSESSILLKNLIEIEDKTFISIILGIVRPRSAYVLLLHFTFASGIGGHAGCAEFFFLP